MVLKSMSYKLAAILLSSLLASSISHAEALKVTEVVSVYDGDTFKVNIPQWPDVIGYRIPIRIKGIDTPEMRGKCKHEVTLAREAKQFTVTQLRQANLIELKEVSRGKFFRLIAEVFVDGESLGDLLLQHKLAVPYNSKAKHNWCQ